MDAVSVRTNPSSYQQNQAQYQARYQQALKQADLKKTEELTALHANPVFKQLNALPVAHDTVTFGHQVAEARQQHHQREMMAMATQQLSHQPLERASSIPLIQATALEANPGFDRHSKVFPGNQLLGNHPAGLATSILTALAQADKTHFGAMTTILHDMLGLEQPDAVKSNSTSPVQRVEAFQTAQQPPLQNFNRMV